MSMHPELTVTGAKRKRKEHEAHSSGQGPGLWAFGALPLSSAGDRWRSSHCSQRKYPSKSMRLGAHNPRRQDKKSVKEQIRRIRLSVILFERLWSSRSDEHMIHDKSMGTVFQTS